MQDPEELYQAIEDLPDLDETIDITKIDVKNRRITTRYVRSDVKASVSKIKLFRFSKPIVIELFDLSTRGALISVDMDIKLNKKITLILFFEDGKEFHIPAAIVRKTTGDKSIYGIKFNRYDNELGEYLLKTQTQLVFK